MNYNSQTPTYDKRCQNLGSPATKKTGKTLNLHNKHHQCTKINYYVVQPTLPDFPFPKKESLHGGVHRFFLAQGMSHHHPRAAAAGAAAARVPTSRATFLAATGTHRPEPEGHMKPSKQPRATWRPKRKSKPKGKNTKKQEEEKERAKTQAHRSDWFFSFAFKEKKKSSLCLHQHPPVQGYLGE